jgi:RecA-family ATPase
MLSKLSISSDNVKRDDRLPWSTPTLEETPAKLYHALWLAAQGYRVFPTIPNGKTPVLGGNWKMLATRSEETIRGWWTQHPDANIARLAEGEFVADIDTKKDGDTTFLEFELFDELPATRTVRTPTGGLHVCYRLPADVHVHGGNDKLGPGIDVKTGAGGYVVAPGSTIDGKEYVWLDDNKPALNNGSSYVASSRTAPVPAWMLAKVKEAKPKHPNAGKRIADEDEWTIERCEHYLPYAPEASQGHRDDTAVAIANRFYDFGAELVTVQDFLHRWNEEKCHPPLDNDDIHRIADSSGRSRLKAIGCDHWTQWLEGFEAYEIEDPEKHAARQAEIDAMEEEANEAAEGYLDEAPKSPALVWLDMSEWDRAPIPERRWAIPNRVPLNQAGLFSGEGGTGKSIIELTKNVAHVLGKPWLVGIPSPVQGPAFYLGAEDDADELHIRLAAIAKHFEVSFEDLIKGGLYAASLLGQDATLCYLSGKSGRVKTTKLYIELYERAGDLKPNNISIDTLSRAFAGNEIDRVQVYAFAQHMQALAMAAESSVTVLSHPSLSGQNSGSGLSGSTAWHGAFRFRQYLRAPTKAEAENQSESDLRLLEFKKNQYGPLGQSITLRYQDGLFLPLAAPTEFEQAVGAEEADATFLKLLERFTRGGRVVCDKEKANNYAPTAFATELDAEIFGKGDFAAAMRRLFAAEKIHVETYGPPSRGWTRLALGKRP